jgi:rsbT co-antagonist protein RsbR
MPATTILPSLLNKYSDEILADWMEYQLASAGSARGRLKEGELREHSREFIRLLREAVLKQSDDLTTADWAPVREMLGSISRSRALQGFTPTETATFVFSFKQPVFERLRKELEKNPKQLAEEYWITTELLDKLGLYTTEMYSESRDSIIQRQQEEMLELSTPVVQLWKGILALPLIGTLDSARTQVVMESLLQAIVSSGSSIAIIDITGVPTVDTLVAQHLMKTVAAARLMGADCIISGIRPQIAQTIVHLGVNLSDVVTRATLADAFLIALERTGTSIDRDAHRN